MEEKKQWQKNKDQYNKEYIKKNIKLYTVLLNRNTNKDMIEYLDGIEHKQEYFRDLISRDMKKEG